MCSCNKKKTAGTKYKVTYPGGTTETKTTQVAAKLAAGRVPGATWAPVPAGT